MARLIPKIAPEEILNPAERKLAKALVSQLGRQIEVFHSFRWRRTAGQDEHLEEAESDFVVVDPENGVLFIEVKGGQVRYDTSGSAWYRSTSENPREPLNKNPFDQAQAAMRDLTGLMEKSEPFRSAEVLPFTFGFAVAIPDAMWTGQLPCNIHADLLWDARKCQDLAAAVESTFARWRHRIHPRLGTREIEAIYSALFPKFGIMPVLWRKVEDQEERLRRLTSDQKLLLSFLSNRSKAAIEGVAGSGKTMLALAKAQECARKGMRTLLLCFNKELQSWLRQAVPESGLEQLTILTFHGLVGEFCAKANVPFNPNERRPDGLNGWRDIAPTALIDACSFILADHKFDALIVDEGQDFEDLWWTALEAIFRDEKNKGCYYVFYDPDQNIFVPNFTIPELGLPFRLPANCRNTKRIAEHCLGLIGKPAEVRDGAPIGDEPEFLRAPDCKQAFRRAGKKVRGWCTPGGAGLKYSQVAVLVSAETEPDWPKDFGTVPLTRDFDKWRANEAVLIASWRRFKGLEADAIAIVEPGGNDSANLRYVARSRAKHLLTLVQFPC